MTETKAAKALRHQQHKADIRKRLRKIEGQARGIARMVDEDTDPTAIITQLRAVTSALRAVTVKVVVDSIHNHKPDHAANAITRALR